MNLSIQVVRSFYQELTIVQVYRTDLYAHGQRSTCEETEVKGPNSYLSKMLQLIPVILFYHGIEFYVIADFHFVFNKWAQSIALCSCIWSEDLHWPSATKSASLGREIGGVWFQILLTMRVCRLPADDFASFKIILNSYGTNMIIQVLIIKSGFSKLVVR